MTVPTLQNIFIERVHGTVQQLFNNQVHATPHPGLHFLGIRVLCNGILAFLGSTTAHSGDISAYRLSKFVSFNSWLWGWL